MRNPAWNVSRPSTPTASTAHTSEAVQVRVTSGLSPMKESLAPPRLEDSAVAGADQAPAQPPRGGQSRADPVGGPPGVPAEKGARAMGAAFMFVDYNRLESWFLIVSGMVLMAGMVFHRWVPPKCGRAVAWGCACGSCSATPCVSWCSPWQDCVAVVAPATCMCVPACACVCVSVSVLVPVRGLRVQPGLCAGLVWVRDPHHCHDGSDCGVHGDVHGAAAV